MQTAPTGEKTNLSKKKIRTKSCFNPSRWTSSPAPPATTTIHQQKLQWRGRCWGECPHVYAGVAGAACDTLVICYKVICLKPNPLSKTVQVVAALDVPHPHHARPRADECVPSVQAPVDSVGAEPHQEPANLLHGTNQAHAGKAVGVYGEEESVPYVERVDDDARIQLLFLAAEGDASASAEEIEHHHPLSSARHAESSTAAVVVRLSRHPNSGHGLG